MYAIAPTGRSFGLAGCAAVYCLIRWRPAAQFYVRPHHMLLRSRDNSLNLKILGYQFPGNQNDEYDSNWLVVEGTATVHGRSWTFRDPCLLTWEAGSLAEYLEARASGTASPRGIGFTEPNLGFAPSGPNTLRVFFALEARPPWLHGGTAEDDEFFVEFTTSPEHLLEAAISLRSQLGAYPARAGRHTFKNAVS